MSWAAVAGAAITTVGGAMGGGDSSQESEPWKPIRPYIKGKGPVPDYVAGNPMINTNWLDYIAGLGGTNWDAPWQPPFATSPYFNPDQTFTPGPPTDGYPYGTPSDPNGAPPPEAPPPEAPPGASGSPGGGMLSPGHAGLFMDLGDNPFINPGGPSPDQMAVTQGGYGFFPGGNPQGGLFADMFR
jgi:hypothetical protein